MTKIPYTASPLKKHIECNDCALYPVCEPTSIGDITFDITESLLLKKQPVRAGEVIYREGEPFSDLYAFTRGSAKEVWNYETTGEQIIGFKLKGELAGQNGIAIDQYPHSLIALEDSNICVLPYNNLINSAHSLPPLLTKIIKLFSIDSYHESQIRRSLAATTNAESKVQAFVYNVASRHKQRNQNYIDLKLSMSRSDIADYLGITKETLSRSLTILQNKGMIEISGKNIHIANFEALQHSERSIK